MTSTTPNFLPPKMPYNPCGLASTMALNVAVLFACAVLPRHPVVGFFPTPQIEKKSLETYEKGSRSDDGGDEWRRDLSCEDESTKDENEVQQ